MNWLDRMATRFYDATEELEFGMIEDDTDIVLRMLDERAMIFEAIRQAGYYDYELFEAVERLFYEEAEKNAE